MVSFKNIHKIKFINYNPRLDYQHKYLFSIAFSKIIEIKQQFLMIVLNKFKLLFTLIKNYRALYLQLQTEEIKHDLS